MANFSLPLDYTKVSKKKKSGLFLADMLGASQPASPPRLLTEKHSEAALFPEATYREQRHLLLLLRRPDTITTAAESIFYVVVVQPLLLQPQGKKLLKKFLSPFMGRYLLEAPLCDTPLRLQHCGCSNKYKKKAFLSWRLNEELILLPNLVLKRSPHMKRNISVFLTLISL